MIEREPPLGRRITRRRALTWLGGLGLAAFVPGCSGDSPSGGATATTSAGGTTTGSETAAGTTTGSGTAADCVLMPELTEGPFYIDLDRVRSDITEGKPGLPIDLRINVLDVDACEPIRDAAVDIWHCDAEGAYSGVSGAGQASTIGETYLRGIQMTDADGAAGFRTVYPGWYTGRAVHIHVKVHLGTDETHTGQLFFEDDVTDAAYETEPYATRGGPDVRNADDSIFAQSQGTTIVAVTHGGEAWSGVVTLGVERA
jgi:protocatechuate 3,4-dioxygenase beta subunit